MPRNEPDEDDKNSEERHSHKVPDSKPHIRFVDEQVGQIREIKVGEVLNITISDLGLSICPVFIDNGVELPASHLADHANDTASAML